MNPKLSEVLELPEKAFYFLENAPEYRLPTGVPYLGMGSSYFAPLAFKYMGIDIIPEMAAEYYYYLAKEKQPLAVILSQSGRSSEALWCTGLFEQYIAVCNHPEAALCTHKAVAGIVPLLAGEEYFSSSKTYTNTLLALFKGFGKDTRPVVQLLAGNMDRYQQQGLELATAVYQQLQGNRPAGLYITGSGPNVATAYQAALIMSESTRLNFQGLPMAQYDHGPKETAMNSVVINIVAKGKSYDRSLRLGATIKAAGAKVFTIEEPAVSEAESVITNIVPFNFMACHLARLLLVQDTFVVGGKVTEEKQ